MSDFGEAWLHCVADRMRSGELYTRELVAACYEQFKSNPPHESAKASEFWINELWTNGKDIPREEFLAIRWWRRKRIGALLHKLLT